MSIEEVFKMMMKESHAGSAHNSQRVFAAWDAASGAGPFTIRRYFRDGRLYVTLSSSVICSQLCMQREALREKINSIISEDGLFISDGSGAEVVKELILK